MRRGSYGCAWMQLLSYFCLFAALVGDLGLWDLGLLVRGRVEVRVTSWFVWACLIFVPQYEGPYGQGQKF